MVAAGRDTLLLLAPDFVAAGRRCYCPACAHVEGVLSYYPAVRAALDVRYIGFERPRTAVIDLIGAANQGLPAVVLAPGTPADTLAGLAVREANGRAFLQDPADIARYLARRHGSGEPH